MILASAIMPSILHAQENRQKLYRIHIKDFNSIKRIEEKGVMVYNQVPDSIIEVLALPEQIDNLGIEGARIEFLANSFKELYENRMGLKTSPPFHNYQSTLAELAGIAARYPVITRLDTIGYSLGGRAICCLKISDNPDQDEDEPPILMLGNHHGNEVHSVEATLYQVNYLVDHYGTDPEVTNWVNSMEIRYVPMVNPDGREAMRRTNDHGVDLNRNYSVGFTASENHGAEPFSEPETRAVRDLAAQYPPVMSLTYHTSGQYVLYSWTHTDQAAPDSSAMIYLGNIISESITYINGGQTGHYTLRQGGRWYFTAGEYCDYMYVMHNTMAFTVEMGISQAPDYTVMPAMNESNLNGMKTLLRQVNKAGVTGLITDSVTRLPVEATIDIPAIDKQGKVPLRLSDKKYGRYYRYLEPGTYVFEVTAPGYRTITRNVTISADSLTNWNIKMEPSAHLIVEEITLTDRKTGSTSGNGDGLINLGETSGLSFTLINIQAIAANGTYTRVTSSSPFVRFLTDSIWFGDIGGGASKKSSDTVLFRLESGCPDGEKLEFNILITDDRGIGWNHLTNFEVFAPVVKLTAIRIDDSAGNGNGAIDNGEIVNAEISFANAGRQGIHDLKAVIGSSDPYFKILSGEDQAEQLGIGESATLVFRVGLPAEVPGAYIAEFEVVLTSAEGYSGVMPFKMNNIFGFYDDFEKGENGWVHQSYGTTSNNHDDWQLGTPAGKALDPDHAFSGSNCWGTDMGWDSYAGTSWDGNYQNNVYNFLRSPVIDCSEMKKVGLKLMRWLNLRIYDYARIKVNDSLVWESPRIGLQDTLWKEMAFDISGIADQNPNVKVVFELESNSSANLGGWNIDGVIVANGLAAGPLASDPFPASTGALLFDCYPSPFKTHTTIRYYIPSPGPVELSIFDLTGNRIRTLISSHKADGFHETEWNGQNESGLQIPPGIYFYRLVSGKSVITKRMIMIGFR